VSRIDSITIAVIAAFCTTVVSPALAGESVSVISKHSAEKELAEIFAKQGVESKSKKLWWLRVYGGGFSIGLIDGAVIGSSKRRDISTIRTNRFHEFASQFWPGSDEQFRYVRAFEIGYRDAISHAKKHNVKYDVGGDTFRSETAHQMSVAVCKQARRIGVSQRLALGVADRAFGDIYQPHPALVRTLIPTVHSDLEM